MVGLMPLACAPEEPVEQDDRVVVKLTVDPVVYIDGAASQHKILERVKNATKSIFPALRRADVMVLLNQQVDIDVVQLKRDTITVVDPATGRHREAARVRFHYVTLAQVPKPLADKRALDLGVLHSVDGARVDSVLTECSANGERERQAATEPWTVFDASLPTCAEAMAREQAAIDTARKKLAHPETEIVPSELDRLYLPLPVRVTRRSAPDAGTETPVQGAHVDDPKVKARAPVAIGAPGAPGAQPAFVQLTKEDRDRELQYETDAEDEKEIRQQARAIGGDLVAGPASPAPPVFGSASYAAPNYLALYLAIIAFVVLLVGQTRRRRR